MVLGGIQGREVVVGGLDEGAVFDGVAKAAEDVLDLLADLADEMLLASWPMAGRSSGGTLPIERMMAVSEPFFPSDATRILSSASRVSAPRTPCSTCA